MTASESSSLLFHPLDRVLGRVSHVRVLRTLSLHGGGIAPTELARRARLSRRGAWNAISALERAGVVEPVGSGHSVPYRLSESHPLAATIRGLFEDEAARTDAVMSAILTAASGLDPVPLGVWIFGSVARGEDRPGSDLDVAIIAERADVARTQASQLRDELDRLGEHWAIQPSVISLARSDLEALRMKGGAFWRRLVEDAIPLLGKPPEELAGPAR